MIKYLIRRRLAKMRDQAGEIGPEEISRARKVLFALFSRYGDVIISLSVIQEFMARYPDKSYFVITSPQMHPYAARLLGGRARILSFNKRRNFLKFFRTIRLLQKEQIDVGFNPWSGGDDARFVISYARRFHFYRDFWGISNLYDRIRDYLHLPRGERLDAAWNPDHIRRIVICPHSTAANKSLSPPDLKTLVQGVRRQFPDAEITIALQPREAGENRGLGELFLFRKSRAASARFLRLLANTDLVISVDAGPLHLADKLGLRTLGLFGPTAPPGVLDRETRVVALRDPSLSQTFCSAPCQDPACLRRLLTGDLLAHRVANRADLTGVNWEREQCRLQDSCQ